MKNYYEILEINEDASKEQIKEAYRRLAQKYHPDRNKNENSTELFKDINEAKQVLLDDNKKPEYDLFLIDYLLANNFSPRQKKPQHQKNYSEEATKQKKFLFTQKFIWISAFIALIIFVIIYFLLLKHNDKITGTTGSTASINKVVFKKTPSSSPSAFQIIGSIKISIRHCGN